MADKKISELTAATTLGDTDVFPIVQGSVTKKMSIATFRSTFDPIITALDNLTINESFVVDVGATATFDDLTAADIVATSVSADTIGATTATSSSLVATVAEIDKLQYSNQQIISSASPISVDNTLTVCQDILTPYVNTLGTGSTGFIKVILLRGVDISVTSAEGAGWSTLTSNTTTSSVVLIYVDPHWVILSSKDISIT